MFKNEGISCQIHPISHHQLSIFIPCPQHTRTTQLCEDFQPVAGFRDSHKGQNIVKITIIREKSFFCCNWGKVILICNNDLILRSEGLKKIQQVHTTRLFESSQKTGSKLIKLIYK